MNRKNIILAATVLAGILLLIGGYVVFGRFTAPPNSNAQTPVQNNEPQSVAALGRLEPADKIIKLTAPQTNGGGNPRIAKLFVREGEEVAVGQIIAEIDGKEKQRAVVSEAFEQVKIAESKLAQVRDGAKRGDLEARKAEIQRLEAEIRKAETELNRTRSRENGGASEIPTAPKRGTIPAPEYVAIKRLEAELENAAVELRRAEKLYARGDVSRSMLEARQTAVKILQRDIERAEATLKTVTDDRSLTVAALTQDLKRARASYTSLAEVRPNDVRAAEAEIENAEAALETAKIILDDLDVKALSSGKILKINTRAGETVSGDGIVEIGETSQMYAVAEIFEEDISKIKLNQNAEMTIRSTNEKLRGEVAEIGSKIGKRSLLDTDPIADVDARVVEVRIKLDKSDSLRVANLTNLRVDVRININ